MSKRVHRPWLRSALFVGSALVGLVFPYAFLLTFFIAYSVYDDLTRPRYGIVPPPPRFLGTEADPDWRLYYENLCESPAESAFLKAMIDFHSMKPDDDALVGNGIRLDLQVRVGRYRLDFVANRTFIIEIDGAQWHSSPEAVERDRIRDEYMISEGYKVLRIPAKIVLSTPKEGLGRVDDFLGRPRVNDVLMELFLRPQTTSTTARMTLGNAFQLASKINTEQGAPPASSSSGVDQGTIDGDLNFDDEVEAFMLQLDAKNPVAKGPTADAPKPLG